MPRTCTVCSNKKRDEIDKALLTGQSFRKIAARFGTSTSALFRHRNNDIAGSIVKAQEAKQIAYGEDLFGQVKDLNARTLRILEQAEASGDPRLALMAVREARGNLELSCRMIVAAEAKEAELLPERSPEEVLERLKAAFRRFTGTDLTREKSAPEL